MTVVLDRRCARGCRGLRVRWWCAVIGLLLHKWTQAWPLLRLPAATGRREAMLEPEVIGFQFGHWSFLQGCSFSWGCRCCGVRCAYLLRPLSLCHGVRCGAPVRLALPALPQAGMSDRTGALTCGLRIGVRDTSSCIARDNARGWLGGSQCFLSALRSGAMCRCVHWPMPSQPNKILSKDEHERMTLAWIDRMLLIWCVSTNMHRPVVS